MHQERTFRTDGGTESSNGFLSPLQISGLACDVKKITTTNEGKLSMTIEATATDNDALERVRNLISIQQGDVMLTFEGVTSDSESLQ